MLLFTYAKHTKKVGNGLYISEVMVMSNIKTSVEELIGNTPILELVNYEKKYDLKARILLKVESVNILGSLKDRIAVAMIDAYEKETDIKPGDTIVESSSGNTAIAMAAIARKRGYRFINIAADQTEERTALLRAYGAEILFLSEHPDIAAGFGLLNENYKFHDFLRDYFAKQSEKDGRKYYINPQWTNKANRIVQHDVTGQEIIRDTDGQVDVFIGGIGSGGSLRGIGDALREVNPNLEIVAFDSVPEEPDSIIGVHNIAHTPDFMLPDHISEAERPYDRAIVVKKEEAYKASNEVAKAEGIFFGVSTGAAVHIATQLAKQPEYEGKTIVAIAYDDVLKYLSTELINPIYQED